MVSSFILLPYFLLIQPALLIYTLTDIDRDRSKHFQERWDMLKSLNKTGLYQTGLDIRLEILSGIFDDFLQTL